MAIAIAAVRTTTEASNRPISPVRHFARDRRRRSYVRPHRDYRSGYAVDRSIAGGGRRRVFGRSFWRYHSRSSTPNTKRAITEIDISSEKETCCHDLYNSRNNDNPRRTIRRRYAIKRQLSASNYSNVQMPLSLLDFKQFTLHRDSTTCDDYGSASGPLAWSRGLLEHEYTIHPSVSYTVQVRPSVWFCKNVFLFFFTVNSVWIRSRVLSLMSL